MRIGLLSFGSPDIQASLVESLRTQDVDVITAEASIDSLASASSEAARLQRADCDGVVLLVSGSKSFATWLGQAGLLLGCPLLLAGPFGTTFLDAVGTLVEVGITFDRLVLSPTIEEVPTAGYSQSIHDWARTNDKRERQRGHEAARKLYGQRFALPPGTIANLDPVLWRRQFGVTVVAFGDDADFSAPDGDANHSLTRHLLLLLDNTKSVETVNADDLVLAAANPPEVVGIHTAAQIVRRAGRYECVFGRATSENANKFALNIPLEVAASLLCAGRFALLPGEYCGALRAACEALDIKPVLFDT